MMKVEASPRRREDHQESTMSSEEEENVTMLKFVEDGISNVSLQSLSNETISTAEADECPSSEATKTAAEANDSLSNEATSTEDDPSNEATSTAVAADNSPSNETITTAELAAMPIPDDSSYSIDYDDESDDRYGDDEDYPKNYTEPAQEDEEDYVTGGYHPVNLGDVFDSRYYTLRKLGWGHFATVWLVFDTKENKYAAIKIPKARRSYIDASKDEYHILKELHRASVKRFHIGAQNICYLWHIFDFYGLERSLHFCMVFEVLGDNLLTLLHKFNYLNINFVKVIAKQMLRGLSFLHRTQIIHTDIKPENVVIALTQEQVHQLAVEAYAYHSDKIKDKPKHMVSAAPEEFRNKYYLSIPENARKRMRKIRKKNREKFERYLKSINQKDLKAAKGFNIGENADPLSSYYEQLQSGNISLLNQCTVKIVDLGNACFTYEQYSDQIQTREYRSPEVIVGCQYDTSADIWSAACLIFEIATGEYLFYPDGDNQEGLYGSDDDHLAKMSEISGPFPKEVYQNGKHYEAFFDEAGNLLRFPEIPHIELSSLIKNVAKFGREDGAEEMANFLKPMLNLNQHERAKAENVAESEWLKLDEDLEMTSPKRRST